MTIDETTALARQLAPRIVANKYAPLGDMGFPESFTQESLALYRRKEADNAITAIVVRRSDGHIVRLRLGPDFTVLEERPWEGEEAERVLNRLVGYGKSVERAEEQTARRLRAERNIRNQAIQRLSDAVGGSVARAAEIYGPQSDEVLRALAERVAARLNTAREDARAEVLQARGHVSLTSARGRYNRTVLFLSVDMAYAALSTPEPEGGLQVGSEYTLPVSGPVVTRDGRLGTLSLGVHIRVAEHVEMRVVYRDYDDSDDAYDFDAEPLTSQMAMATPVYEVLSQTEPVFTPWAELVARGQAPLTHEAFISALIGAFKNIQGWDSRKHKDELEAAQKAQAALRQQLAIQAEEEARRTWERERQALREQKRQGRVHTSVPAAVELLKRL